MLNKVIIPLSVIFLTTVFSFNFYLKGQHFTLLSESFSKGKFYFLEMPGGSWDDTTGSGDKHYWPGGPFPALVLIPFVSIFNFLELTFYQGYLQAVLVMGAYFISYKIARKINYSHFDALFLAYAFCFSTIFLGASLVPSSWLFPQVLSVFIIFLIIYGHLLVKSQWLLGILIGLSFMTRFPTLGILVFFILDIFFREKRIFLNRFKEILKIGLPVIIAVLVVGFYNQARFGNFFDTGYLHQVLRNESLVKAREYGLAGLVHIPGNLYYFLLSTPVPIFNDKVSHVLKFPYMRANPWGISIFITSPIFIYLFFVFKFDRFSKILIITILTMSLPIFLYYGIGWKQAGYRYSLDFLPILFWLLIRNYKDKYRKLSNGFKILILISSLTNMYFVMNLFYYP